MIDRSVSTSYFPAGRAYGAPGAWAPTAEALTMPVSSTPYHVRERRRRVIIGPVGGRIYYYKETAGVLRRPIWRRNSGPIPVLPHEPNHTSPRARGLARRRS